MSNNRFKFRVWDNINKRYDKDLSLIDKDGDLCYQDGEKYCNGEHPEDFTIEQCTGILDKNSKLIYEGDVVKCDIDFVPDGRVGLIRRVVSKDGAFQLISEDGGFYFLMGFHNIEIIGNIHKMEGI